MAKNREKPESYMDDPSTLADQIERGLADYHTDDPWVDYDGTTFYVGEMRIIAAVLRAYKG